MDLGRNDSMGKSVRMTTMADRERSHERGPTHLADKVYAVVSRTSTAWNLTSAGRREVGPQEAHVISQDPSGGRTLIMVYTMHVSTWSAQEAGEEGSRRGVGGGEGGR